jgi:hypothetical protein
MLQRIVMPAQAGIQSNMRPKDTIFLSASHGVSKLDSGLRRNDDRQ